jgi:excisionase family DNA binding protein
MLGTDEPEGDGPHGKRADGFPCLKLAYSVKQAVAATGVGRSTIYDEIRNGRLRSRMIRGRRIILGTDLLAWLRGEDPDPTVCPPTSISD